MWLITEHGFWSIVQHRSCKGVLLVRGRCKSDLCRFAALAALVSRRRPVVHCSVEADYPYRLLVDRGVAMRVLVSLVQSVCYDNFKRRVVERQPARSALYKRIWWVLKALSTADTGEVSYGV